MAADRATRWPALPVADWQDTRDTLQLWTQVVGKTKLALAPPLNHWWGVTFHLGATGLTTGLMPTPAGGLEVAFDLCAHRLRLTTTDGQQRELRLEPRTVADFYAEYRAHLADLGVDVTIDPLPVELPEVIAFDRGHRARRVRPAGRERLLALDRLRRVGDGPVPGRVPRQGQHRALLLGRLRPRRAPGSPAGRAPRTPAASRTAPTG